MIDLKPILQVHFYKAASGNEPLREWLKGLPPDDRKANGEDIKTAQFGWPVGMPLVECLRKNGMKEENIGRNFDDFLKEEGILEEVRETAIKRVLAFQIQQAMKEKNLSKSAMARRMRTSRSVLDRLLDPTEESVALQTMKKAACATGRSLKIELV